ncbi:hypothetical protein Tco_0017778 [Tanacetum coccineum]
MLDNSVTITNATSFAPGMFKLDLDPLAPRLLKNRDAHIDYLKYTQDQADIRQGIVEQAKTKQPLDNVLDFTCKHAKRIQELLIYVRDTCPNAYKPSEKLVADTPMNKVKKVRITSTKVVPIKETSSHSVETQKPEIKVYRMRPKQVKSIGSSKKAKIVESKIANNSEPNHLWGSNATDIPSSSSLVNNSSLCYPTNDSEDLGKLNAKADIGIFVGYAPAKKAFRIYNRRTRKIMETIHVMFDELTTMASEQFSSGPEPQLMTPATSSSGLVPNLVPQ